MWFIRKSNLVHDHMRGVKIYVYCSSSQEPVVKHFDMSESEIWHVTAIPDIFLPNNSIQSFFEAGWSLTWSGSVTQVLRLSAHVGFQFEEVNLLKELQSGLKRESRVVEIKDHAGSCQDVIVRTDPRRQQ